MKKYLIYLIPGLLLLNACNEGHLSLGEESRILTEAATTSAATAPKIDESDLAVPLSTPTPTPTVTPEGNGSTTLSPNQPLHGPITLTPAQLPSGGNGGNGYQPSGDSGPQAQLPWQIREAGQVQGVYDDNTNLNANAEDQGQGSQGTGLQAIGDRPKLSVSPTQLQVYDPFCNCFKTGPNNGPIELNKVPKVQAAGSDEDDDD
jgi:hypothetical protein